MTIDSNGVFWQCVCLEIRQQQLVNRSSLSESDYSDCKLVATPTSNDSPNAKNKTILSRALVGHQCAECVKTITLHLEI